MTTAYPLSWPSGFPRATKEAIARRYRKLAHERHPDTGGSDALMAELNAARDAALREVGA